MCGLCCAYVHTFVHTSKEAGLYVQMDVYVELPPPGMRTAYLRTGAHWTECVLAKAELILLGGCTFLKHYCNWITPPGIVSFFNLEAGLNIYFLLRSLYYNRNLRGLC